MIRALVTRVREYGDPSWSEPMSKMVQPTYSVPKSDSCRRVAMHQHTTEEWAALIAKAQWDYRRLGKPHCWLYNAILGAWAAIWLAIYNAGEQLTEINRR